MSLSQREIKFLAIDVTLAALAVASVVLFAALTVLAVRKFGGKTLRKAKSYMEPKNTKAYNVIFTGTCKNVGNYIERVLKYVDDCGQKFNNYAVIIYENDSSDETRAILNRMKKTNYYYIFEDNVKEPRRTKRLERGRNMCLDKTRELNKDNYYQYLIVLDMDGVNGKGTFVKTIDTCFVDMNWDVLTGNQARKYYDLWALRNSDLNYDCWTDTKNGNCDTKNPKYPAGSWKEVDSAFGGIGIYKLSSIPKHCKYVGEHKDGQEKCEHVEFNECIKDNGGKLYINGDFFNDGDERAL